MAALLDPTDFSPPGMVDASAAQQQQAQTLDIGVNAMQSAQDIMMNHLAKQAELSGQMAGAKAGNQRDPNTGRLLPITSLPDDISYYSTAFRDAAITSYSNNAVNDFRAVSDKARRDNFDNPKGYQDTINAYQTEMIKGLDPRVLGSVLPHLTEISNAAYSGIADTVAPAVRKQSIDGTEQILTAATGDIQAKLAPLGYDPVKTPQVIDEAINTIYKPAWQRLKGVDSLGHGDDWAMAQERTVRQQLMTTALNAEAQHMGQTLTTVDAKGQVSVDTDAFHKWVDKMKADPTLASYYKSDELDNVLTHAAASFTNSSDARTQDIAKVNIQAQTKLDSGVADLNSRLNTAMDHLRIFGSAATDEINQVISDGSKIRFNTNDETNNKEAADWALKATTEKNKILNDPNLMESDRLYYGSVQAEKNGVGFNMKMAGVGEANTKSAILRRQDDYDKEAAAASGNPNFKMSAQNDPNIVAPLLFDPQRGSIATTGSVLPRVAGDFGIDLSSIPTANAANVAKIYHMLEDQKPVLAASLGDDVRNNIMAWELSNGSKDTYYKLRAADAGARPKDERDDAIKKMDDLAKSDKTYVNSSVLSAVQNAADDSEPINVEWRKLNGLPESTVINTLPSSVRQNGFSFITHLIPGLDAATGNVNPAQIDLYTTPDTQDKFLEAKKAAAAIGGLDEKGRNANALQNMDNQGFSVSRMLMPPLSVDQDHQDATRDYSGSWTYGQWGPEKVFNANSWEIAYNVSHFVANLEKRDTLTEPTGEAGRGFWSKVWNNEYPPGDPAHWAWENALGRTRLEPVKGFDPSHPRYWIKGLVLTGTQPQWVTLNPNDPYTFDRSRDTPTADELKQARDVALKARQSIPGGTPMANAGNAVAGDIASTATITRDQAADQLREHIQKGNNLSVTSTFDKVVLPMLQAPKPPPFKPGIPTKPNQ